MQQAQQPAVTVADVRARLLDGTLGAVLFDLDGVITDTAALHAVAWQRLFDDFLAEQDVGHARFELPADYLAYVDGKPRYDGVQSFLDARGLALPRGMPSDPSDAATVCGLGNRKDALFNAVLAAQGVTEFDGSVRLLEALRRRHVATACVSSSKNCRPVLDSCGLLGAFDTIVDGADIERGVAGKPAPDSYLCAAGRLAVAPAAAAVVEDALSGVAAGRRGDFGLVIGVDRGVGAAALRAAGADVVVTDLAAFLPLD